MHYRLELPRDVTAPVTVTARLLYRKFDTEYMRFVEKDPEYKNDLPVLVLAEDHLTFPVVGSEAKPANPPSAIDPWQRWNDYGIALLRKGRLGELRQAAQAFEEVERLGKADDPPTWRVYIKEGRADGCPAALARAAKFDPPANGRSSGSDARSRGERRLRPGCVGPAILRGGFAQVIAASTSRRTTPCTTRWAARCTSSAQRDGERARPERRRATPT